MCQNNFFLGEKYLRKIIKYNLSYLSPEQKPVLGKKKKKELLCHRLNYTKSKKKQQ